MDVSNSRDRICLPMISHDTSFPFLSAVASPCFMYIPHPHYDSVHPYLLCKLFYFSWHPHCISHLNAKTTFTLGSLCFLREAWLLQGPQSLSLNMTSTRNVYSQTILFHTFILPFFWEYDLHAIEYFCL